MNRSLIEFLHSEETLHNLDPKLTRLMLGVAEACKNISNQVRHGALAGVLGLAGQENVQGENQKVMDVVSNDIFVRYVQATGSVCGMVSEEVPDPIAVDPQYPIGPYVICFDPLDGSSNLDINVSIGSIFSVTPAVRPKREPVVEDFLQPGNKQVLAGYCMYGPQTQLVFTLGRGVVMFTLNPETGIFEETGDAIAVPTSAKEFAINCSNMRHWEEPVKRYIAELLEGKEGVRGKDFNMRWVAAMVAEVHRILQRGGIFMYPRDHRDLSKPGKLRLLYEANPMSLLMENAGAAATNGHVRILDIQPEKIHQRVAVFLGAREEVERVTSYHQSQA